MAAIGATNQDGIIAIGVDNIKPFLLKGHGFNDVESGNPAHTLHMIPEDTSRVAIMEVSTITSCPYVEIHYKAIDLVGNKMGVSNPCLLIEKQFQALTHILMVTPLLIISLILLTLSYTRREELLHFHPMLLVNHQL